MYGVVFRSEKALPPTDFKHENAALLNNKKVVDGLFPPPPPPVAKSEFAEFSLPYCELIRFQFCG